MKVYTYLLKSLKDNTYYTGISKNPHRRVEKHNNGHLRTTAKKRPFLIVYLKEHQNYSEARRHEKWLKKKNRQYKDKLAQLAPPEIGGVK